MKQIAVYRQYLKYLALVGLALVTAGLLAGVVSGWHPLPVGLLLGGIGLLLVGLAFSGGGEGRFWSQRSTEAGANALLSTLAVLAILILVNLVVARYSTRIDLTENRLFTLAPQSQEVVQSLKAPVNVVVFDAVPNPQDRQLLESYKRAGSEFSFEYVDPRANPRRAQAAGVNQPGMVFLDSGDKHQLVQTVNQTDRLSERTLTNALDQLVNNRSLTVYFTTGHREFQTDGSKPGFAQAAKALEEKNYTVKPLNLVDTPQIPQDASVVVVAGPAEAFFDSEVKSLQDYLNRGGSLMLMIDPQTKPNLGGLLDDWGVVLDDRIVLDTSGAGQIDNLGPAAPLVTNYGDHPITRDFSNGRSFYPLARPLVVQEVPGVTETPILQTSPQSQAEAISAKGELQYDPNAAPAGPFTLGVALSRPIKADSSNQSKPSQDTKPDASTGPTADQPPSEARLVVIGNASFATDGLFDQQLNGDVFLNSISWLGQQNDTVLSIRPKEATNRRITMTVQQRVGLGLFSLLVLPLIGLVLAVVMWIRRR